MIAFPCPECQATLKAPEDKAGARTKCPKCGSPVRVPTAKVEAQPVRQPTPAPSHQVVHVAAPSPSPKTARRTAGENLDDGDDELASGRRGRAEASGGAAAHSLGIAAMVLGGVGLLLSLIPCVGMIGLPLSGLGLLLGLIGGVAALARGGRGVGFPIAGSAISGLALLIGGFWALVVYSAAKGIDDGDKTPAHASEPDHPAQASTKPFGDGAGGQKDAPPQKQAKFGEEVSVGDLRVSVKEVISGQYTRSVWFEFGQNKIYGGNFAYAHLIVRNVSTVKIVDWPGQPTFGGAEAEDEHGNKFKRKDLTHYRKEAFNESWQQRDADFTARLLPDQTDESALFYEFAPPTSKQITIPVKISDGLVQFHGPITQVPSR